MYFYRKKSGFVGLKVVICFEIFLKKILDPTLILQPVHFLQFCRVLMYSDVDLRVDSVDMTEDRFTYFACNKKKRRDRMRKVCEYLNCFMEPKKLFYSIFL